MKAENILDLLEKKDKRSPMFKDIESDSRKIYDTHAQKINDSLNFNKEVVEEPVKPFNDYITNNYLLNWPLYTALYAKSWVVKKAIDKPAVDMIRAGITINLDKNDDTKNKKDKIYKRLKAHRNDFIKLVKWGRLYGGSLIVMMPAAYTDDSQYLKKPDWKLIRKNPKINFKVVDRWYGCSPSPEKISDTSSNNFGKPKSYRISFPNGHSFEVLADYCLRYEGLDAPDIIKYGELQGWGYSIITHILNEIARDDQTKYSITKLIDKSLIEVIKMPGMAALFSSQDEASQRMIEDRLQMIQLARDINSLTLLDTDDDYEQNSFSGLSGLSDMIEINMWLVAAALDMQNTLFGDLKNGFSADDDALERYDETILNLNETHMRSVIADYLAFEYNIFEINDEVSFDFNSLLTKKKDKEFMESIKNYIDTLSQLLQDGIIDMKRYALALNNYTKNNAVDFELDDEYVDTLENKMDEEIESINLEGNNSEFENENFDITTK